MVVVTEFACGTGDGTGWFAVCSASKLPNRLDATQISTVGLVIFSLGLGSLALLPEAATVNDFL